MKEKIVIINTGGTFNKFYDKISGENKVTFDAVPAILEKWMADYEVVNIIGKDSLDFTDEDRELLYKTIKATTNPVVVVHGTDTMNKSAEYLNEKDMFGTVVFTGAMVPWSIDPTEGSANLAMAIGVAQGDPRGIYICMNGLVDKFWKVEKDRKNGKFISTRNDGVYIKKPDYLLP